MASRRAHWLFLSSLVELAIGLSVACYVFGDRSHKWRLGEDLERLQGATATLARATASKRTPGWIIVACFRLPAAPLARCPWSPSAASRSGRSRRAWRVRSRMASAAALAGGVANGKCTDVYASGLGGQFQSVSWRILSERPAASYAAG